MKVRFDGVSGAQKEYGKSGFRAGSYTLANMASELTVKAGGRDGNVESSARLQLSLAVGNTA